MFLADRGRRRSVRRVKVESASALGWPSPGRDAVAIGEGSRRTVRSDGSQSDDGAGSFLDGLVPWWAFKSVEVGPGSAALIRQRGYALAHWIVSMLSTALDAGIGQHVQRRIRALGIAGKAE